MVLRYSLSNSLLSASSLKTSATILSVWLPALKLPIEKSSVKVKELVGSDGFVNQFPFSTPSTNSLVRKIAGVATLPLLITAQSTKSVSVGLNEPLSLCVPVTFDTTILSDHPFG